MRLLRSAGKSRLGAAALRRARQIGPGLLAISLFGACGGAKSELAKAKLSDGVRSRAIEHEACDEKLGRRVEAVDVDNDGKPDIRRVYSGDVEICRISDLNHDGKPDMFEYFDAEGRLRRREADYDDNGIVNTIQVFENGKLASAELDTSNQGFIDTWDTFDSSTGRLLKRERDSNGDGRIDQWWEFQGDQVTIASDRNGDGLPDPESVITLQSSTFTPVVASSTSPPTPPGAPPAPPKSDSEPSASDAGALAESSAPSAAADAGPKAAPSRPRGAKR
jgi:hypothetical protein